MSSHRAVSAGTRLFRPLALACAATAVGLLTPAEALARDCRAYAGAAVLQQNLNLEFRCGYRGIRWHLRWAPHHDWCAIAPAWRPLEEFRIRNRRLRACGVPEPALPAPWLG